MPSSPSPVNDALSDGPGDPTGFAGWAVHACFAVALLCLLVVVGQPILTDDLWWHLALGRAYAAEGLWLEHDPLLFSAPGPPMPAAWLSDLLLHGTKATFGFTGLRILHVITVAGICALVWRLIARGCRSPLVASLGSMLVIAVSTYRLVQLRPHLATMLAALVLASMLLDGRRVISRRRIAALFVLFVAWVNLHAGFVLGLAMLGAIGAGWVVLDVARSGRVSTSALSPRTRSLIVAALVAALATFINPGGFDPHLAYFIAGDETPSLARVGDEWSRVALFSWPRPVDLANWIGTWTALLATAIGAFAVARSRSATASTAALGALSLLACAFALMAVRFSWLCVFPLAFAAAALPVRDIVTRPRGRVVALCSALLLLFGYLQLGNWPTFSRGVGLDYARPYAPSRYQAHVVWWLADVGLSGPLFAEYSQSGFISHWLAPQIKTLINGSLNVRSSAIDANLPLRERRGSRPGESYAELLDREGIEIFLGIRLPQVKPTPRPWFHTTAHLEGVEGWVLVFRNLDSAVYLRDQPSNDANFDRVTRWYAEHGFLFERTRGLNVAAVIEGAPDWTVDRGMIPRYYRDLKTTVTTGIPENALRSRLLLAEFHAALGLYSSAIELDRVSLRERPADNALQRRIIWCLLRERRLDEASARASAFASQAPLDALSREIIAVAQAAGRGDLTRDALDQRIATLPVFNRSEAYRLIQQVQGPEIRYR